MNIQQLEYIVAVDQYRHFVQAADQCCVTQPTLSMMIKKLEDELNVKIFDRTRQPIVPTDIGRQIIDQARTVLREAGRLAEMAQQYNGDLSGDLRIGIIPTVAPYLLPVVLQAFLERYPAIRLQVSEMITERIIAELKHGTIDAGIVATATGEKSLRELPLYRERFYVYVSQGTALHGMNYILPEAIDPRELWLLEEGHCFRTQIQKLCELSRDSQSLNFHYRSGSIETLIRLVERNGGITILPEMAVLELSEERKQNVRSFEAPVPAREVGFLVNREQVKSRLIEALQSTILDQLPASLLTPVPDMVVL
ncbi:hydrogen peroxide-inducible genes activator [Telluribacter sp.]|jgi:LysR family hydrogen peroxide-inducible transcriptional activator|uniref:hydrogen peroxide-inducible genes activator n=1 Tax=Telluribacter sp. TaxID=1978767 RepID=UPI002E117D04|nr:LysR substrate-binding domain-containing protein [Telluribacter sp.]